MSRKKRRLNGRGIQTMTTGKSMSPEELAKEIVWDVDMEAAIAHHLRCAEFEGRRSAIAIIQEYLLFDSQRAVSWHEIQDCIAAIRRGD